MTSLAFFSEAGGVVEPAALAAARATALEHAEARFYEGDRYGLWMAIVLSAAGKKVLPQWARAALKALDEDLRAGEVPDMNEGLGWRKTPETHRATRRAATDWETTSAIARRIVERRLQGDGIDAELFDDIAQELRVSRRKVERVWVGYRAMIDDAFDNKDADRVTLYQMLDVWVDR